MLVLLSLGLVAGVAGLVLLIVLLRKRGAGAAKILALLGVVAVPLVLLFLLIAGAGFVIDFKSQRAVAPAEMKWVDSRGAEKQALASRAAAEVEKRRIGQASSQPNPDDLSRRLNSLQTQNVTLASALAKATTDMACAAHHS